MFAPGLRGLDLSPPKYVVALTEKPFSPTSTTRGQDCGRSVLVIISSQFLSTASLNLCRTGIEMI
jgi:hypothetical protein